MEVSLLISQSEVVPSCLRVPDGLARLGHSGMSRCVRRVFRGGSGRQKCQTTKRAEMNCTSPLHPTRSCLCLSVPTSTAQLATSRQAGGNDNAHTQGQYVPIRRQNRYPEQERGRSLPRKADLQDCQCYPSSGSSQYSHSVSIGSHRRPNKDEKVDDDAFVQVSEYCFNVCEVLETTVQERNPDDIAGLERYVDQSWLRLFPLQTTPGLCAESSGLSSWGRICHTPNIPRTRLRSSSCRFKRYSTCSTHRVHPPTITSVRMNVSPAWYQLVVGAPPQPLYLRAVRL